MAGRLPVSDNTIPSCLPSEPPPPYTPFDPNNQSCPPYYTTNPATAPQRTVVVDSPDMVFSKLARFNDGISKPTIPPPPPGCMPNQYQLMQMQGPVQVVFGRTNPQQQNQQQNPTEK